MEESGVESFTDVPIINLSLLRRDSLERSSAINQIRQNCQKYGFFQVVRHGISDSIIEEALEVNAKFFEMPMAAKEELMSDDVYKEARFAKVEVGDFSRDFLKLYGHPLHQYVTSWPGSPLDYRDKMGMYSKEVRKLCIELFEAILESLNLPKLHGLKQSFEQGFQILAANNYPPCLESSAKPGVSPHTDHSIITVILQTGPGLQVMDSGAWKNVPHIKGSLQVLVGDHLEVISNGLYKSAVHRAVPSCNETRLSLASFQSLGMDDIVEVAKELEDGERRYRGSSLRDFIKHLASKDKDKRAFIETLKN